MDIMDIIYILYIIKNKNKLTLFIFEFGNFLVKLGPLISSDDTPIWGPYI